MIKDILACLSVGKPHDVAGDFAISVAALFQAHLSARAMACKLPIGGSILDGASAEFIDNWTAEREAAAAEAKKSFDERARLADIRSDSSVVTDYVAEVAQIFAETARHYDLSVVAQEERENDLPESLIIEAALFESGRPVLVVPYIQKGALTLDRVLVCWNGSPNAARAIGDAMPFLKRAKEIEVTIVLGESGRSDEIAGADIGEHLARHRLKVEVERLSAIKGDVTDTILSHAADCAADFLVMGGYGHSRLREFILGGVTRGILRTMTLPVLMSH